MMEGQKFTSDSVTSSPKLLQCFQADRFLKSINNLNIPDTIPEMSSTELSGNYLKMEEPKTPTNGDCENKENLVSNLSFKSDESSASTIIAVDNSFLVKCEKKLLENSISDSESFLSANKSIKNENLSDLSKKLGLFNETISTPTHILRKQISILKNEIAESDEFHDLEIKILKEEKHEVNGEELPYEQVIEKYSALLDLYTSLKNEYDEYRKEQEKLQYKTADCLETLCSQIEASDSSLNFSSASFASFNTDIKSSTMMNNISEVEATVINDATLMDVDPLAATQEKTFKTPVHLPFKSSKKLFPQESVCNKTKRTPCSRAEISLDDGTIQMLTLKTADKVKEVEELEQRLIKVEDLVSSLQSENERLTKEYLTESKKLKDDLLKKTEQFEELTKKLFTETISLNPALKETLVNASGTKLLTVFIETIMESCKSIQDDLVRKFYAEKEDWELQRKSQAARIVELENQITALNDQESNNSQFEELKKQYEELKEQMQEAENLISVRNEEIRLLQSHDSGIRKTREDLALANETITKLQSQLSSMETEKQEIQKRYQELEEVTQSLREEINSQKTLTVSYEQENENLKTSFQQSEEIVAKLKSDLEMIEKEGSSEVEELRNKEVSLRNEILNIFKESKEVFTDFLPEFYNGNTKTFLKTLNEIFDVKYGSSEIVSAFTETIFTCCEKLKTDLNQSFESKKAELLNQIEDLKNDIKDLNEMKVENEVKMSEIIAEKKNCQKLNESLEDKLAELELEESQAKKLREELTQTEEVLIKLKTQLISVEGEKEEMENRCSDLEKTNTDLQTLISTKEAIIKDLENSIEIIQKELESVKEINEKLEESKLGDLALANETATKLQSQLSEMETEKQELQNRYKELEEVIQFLREEINSQKALIISHEQENENLKISVQQSQEMIEKLQSNLEMETRCSDLEKRNADLQNLIPNKEAIIKELENSLEIIKKELESAKEISGELEESKMKLNELALANETLTKLKSELLALGVEKEEIVKRYQELEEVTQSLREEINSQKALIVSHEQEKQILTSSLQESQETMEKLKSNMETEVETRCSDLEKRNSDLQNLISNKEAIIKDLENSLEIIKKELESAKEISGELEESKTKLAELALANETVSNLQSQLSTMETERQEIQSRYQELEQVTQSLRDELNTQKAFIVSHEQEKENLIVLLQQSQEMIEKLQSNLEMETRCSDLEKRNADLQNLIPNKEAIIKELENSLEIIKKELESAKEISGELEESKMKLNELALANETLTKLKSELLALGVEKEEIVKRYQELEEVTQSLREEINSQKALIVSHEQEKQILTSSLQESQETIEKLNSNMETEVETRCSDLEKRNSDLQNLISNKEAIIKDLENSLEIIKKELESAKEISGELEESKTKLAELALANETVSNLQSQLSTMETERQEIQSRYQELEQVTQSLRDELNTQKAFIVSHEQEKENLIALLQQSQEMIENLKSKLEMIEKQDSSEKENVRSEVLKIFKESKEVLTDFLPEFCKDSSETLLNKLNVTFADKYGSSEIVSTLSEIIFTCCEKVKEDLNKNFETNKAEFLIQIEDLKNDINEIKAENELKINEIITDRDNYKKLKESLEGELAEMESEKSQIKMLGEEITETKEDLLKLKSQVLSFKDEKVEMENRCLDLEKANADLQALISTKDTFIKDLENSIETIQRELESAKEINEKLEESKVESLSKLNETVTKLESELSAVVNEKEEIEKRYQELEKVNQCLREEINSQKALVLSHEQENENLKTSIQQSQETIETLKSDLEMIEKRDSSEKEEIRTEVLKILTESKEVVRDSLPDFCKENTESLRKTLNEVFEVRFGSSEIVSVFSETMLACCEKVKEDLNKNFETNKAEFLIQIEDLKNDINEIKAENEMKISEIVAEKDNYQKLNESLERKLAEMESEESQVKILSEELTQAKEDLIQLKSQIMNIEGEKAEMENRCSDLEKANTDLQTLISTKETMIKDLENSIEVIQNELETVKEVNKKLEESKMESLSKLDDLALANETVSKLQSQLSAMETEKQETQTRCQELEEFTQSLREEINSQKSLILSHEQEKEKLTNSLQESQEMIEKLQSNIEEIEKQYSGEVEELRNREVSLRSEILKIFKESKEVLTSFIPEFCKESTETLLNTLNDIFVNTYGSSEIVSAFGETIFTCCEKVKEYLNKTFESSKAELVTQIEDLQNDITDLNKIKAENEMKVSELIAEKENDKKLNESLEVKLAETKEDLMKLKTQMEDEKVEMENRYSDLDKRNTDLQTLIDTKESTIRDLESSLEIIQKELESAKEVREKLEESGMKLNEELKEVKSELEQLLGENHLLQDKSNNYNNLLNTMEELFDVEKFVQMSTEEVSELFNEKIKSNPDFEVFSEVLETLESALKNQHVKTNEMINELKDFKNSYNEALKCLEDSQQTISNVFPNSEDLNASEIFSTMEISSDNKILSVFRTTVKDACNLIRNQIVRTFENEKNELAKQQNMVVQELVFELKSLKEENNEVLEILEDCKKRMETEVVEPFSEKLCELVADFPNGKPIISLITSLLIIVTKNIEDELYNKFSSKRNELEKQRNLDLSLISDLQDQIKEFTEKSKETNCLQDRILEVENSLSTLSEEFKAQKAALEKTEESLAEAEGTIVKLKSQLRTIKTEKLEIITRCQQLEEDAATLQADIDTKDTILKGFEEIQSTKQKIENENGELKERLLQSEEIIGNLKVTLQNAREEQNNKELEWKREVDFLKSEKENLVGLTGKVESLEENKKQLMNVLSDIQSFLDMPKDVLPKLLSGQLENEKIFTERISNFTKSEVDSLKTENYNLKCGNENLKEKIKELNKMISENDRKENLMLDNSVQTQYELRSKSGRKSDLCARKLDKLEEINQNLTELLTRILTETDFPNVEKLKFCSARDYPNLKKQVLAHIEGLESKIKELTADNSKLDEECDSYAQTIKDLQKEAAKSWKTNKEKLEALETELTNVKEEKKAVEKEKEELMSKISKLENECQKLKCSSKGEGSTHPCNCGTDSKKMNDLKRTLLMKEQKILELQDVENQNSMYKSQIKYLETAIQQEKKKINEEKEKNKRLENEIKEMKKNGKANEKNSEENQILDQLRMGGSLAGGVVQDYVDKEKMRKLAKDIGILKELCRARYAEIKRLEAENAALRTLAPKNPNQLDSPVRTRSYNAKSKNLTRELWKPETEGKENSVLL